MVGKKAHDSLRPGRKRAGIFAEFLDGDLSALLTSNATAGALSGRRPEQGTARLSAGSSTLLPQKRAQTDRGSTRTVPGTFACTTVHSVVIVQDC